MAQEFKKHNKRQKQARCGVLLDAFLCFYVNAECQRQPTHRYSSPSIRLQRPHTACRKKKKKRKKLSPIHLRVKRRLETVERQMSRARVFVHSALPCNNFQLDVITHDSRVAQINKKKNLDILKQRFPFKSILAVRVRPQLYSNCEKKKKNVLLIS